MIIPHPRGLESLFRTSPWAFDPAKSRASATKTAAGSRLCPVTRRSLSEEWQADGTDGGQESDLAGWRLGSPS